MIKSCVSVSALVFLLLASACRQALDLGEAPQPGAGRLLITEVGAGSPETGFSWFEVYNASTETAELSRYTLRTCWRPRRLPEAASVPALRESVPLPELAIPPGAYAVLCGVAQGSASYARGNLVFLCLRSSLVPDWSEPGFEDIELLLDGASVDFLRFGASEAEPASPGAWSEDGALPSLAGAGLLSLGRAGSNADTDEAEDWVASACASPGGPNDITDASDLDCDGLPDASESPGGSYAGLDLSEWGAGPDQPDIFIQLDYMAGEDPGTLPRREALEKVVQAFAEHGIRLHIDAGRLFHPEAGPSPADFDFDDRSHEQPFAPRITMGVKGGFANLYDYKNRSMELSRRQVFHYLLFASSQMVDGSGGSSGLGEFQGNDFMVTLGGYGLSAEPGAELNKLVNFQAATLMHELGHNLGLRHGGRDSSNYKPNYPSVMNYLYQLAGLPDPETDKGDRYYFANASAEYLADKYPEREGLQLLKDGPDTSAFRLDYSDGRAPSLRESAVDEAGGLGRCCGSQGYVDFDLDGARDPGSYARDLNPHWTNRPGEILEDCDDWSTLKLDFMLRARPDFVGRSARLLADPAFSDVQEVVEESPIRFPR